MPICGIYVIENIVNGKLYIGQSLNVERRLHKHKYCLNHDCHDNAHLQNAWNKYGKKNFVFKVIEECLEHNLNEKEIYFIQEYATKTQLYNLKSGGSNGRMSEHSKQKIRNSRLGKSSWNKGIATSEKTKEKIRKALTGRTCPDELRQKHSEIRKGKPCPCSFKDRSHSEETKKKLSDDRKGKRSNLSDESRKKIGEASSLRNKGKSFSEEHKRKIGEAHKGKVVSEETRNKLREARKRQVITDEARKKMSESQKRRRRVIE